MAPFQTALFDYFGVLGKDPNALLVRDFHFTPEQITAFAAITEASNHGAYAYRMEEYYADIGSLFGYSGTDTKAALDKRSGYDVELIAVFDRLRSEGVKVGVISNADQSLHDGLKAVGIYDRFDLLITSGEMARRTKPKPDPSYYQYAIKLLGGTPDASVYFDDRQENVDGARSAGILAAFLYTTVQQCQKDLASVGL